MLNLQFWRMLAKTKESKKIDNMIRNLSENLINGKEMRISIDGVGSFVCKNGIVAVVFNKKYETNPLPGTITEDGAVWLKSNLGIEISRPTSSRSERIKKMENIISRPMTAGARPKRSISQRPDSEKNENLATEPSSTRFLKTEQKIRPFSAANLTSMKKFENTTRPQSEQLSKPQNSQSA